MKKFWWQKLDYVLLILVFVFVIYGIVMIYSANYQDKLKAVEFKKQIIFFLIGLALMVILASVNYKTLVAFEGYFYIFTLLILLAVIFVGRKALGAQRWINIGGYSFQPSEFAKVFLIISLSAKLVEDNALRFEKLFGTFIYIGIPIVLIIIQPDLGTSLVVLAVLIALLYVRGFKVSYLIMILVTGALALPFILKGYQKQRILTFLNPQGDPTGAGWNIIQSIVSIGSGGIFGKGLFHGTQTQLQFVPEHSTDFIFSVLGEELGFVGGASLILLYFFFLWRILYIAKGCKDKVSLMICIGICTMFFFHIFVNIGMTMGIMPVTGLPLPLVSYGGSSLITNMAAIGIVLGISMRQEEHFFK